MVRNIIEAWLGRMIGASQWWVLTGKNRAHEKGLKGPKPWLQISGRNTQNTISKKALVLYSYRFK